MANAPLNTDILDRAIVFAVRAHAGSERRGKGFPYIVHPMEAVAIVATMTADQELLAAAALHDTVEDTGVTVEQLRQEFGSRIADLVAQESDSLTPGLSEAESWKARKQAAIDRLSGASHEAKMVALGEYVVTEDGRYGIRFRRILDKKSYSRATADNPEKVAQYAAEFAGMCRQLHSTVVDTTQFEDVKERYYRLLEANQFFTTAEKDKIARFIADTPDEQTAIHGDLQYSNHLFDVGMVYLCCNLSPEEFILETFHMPKSLAIEFWRNFAPEYFGDGLTFKEIEELIRPYAGLKTLIIERDTGGPMPVFREALKPIL